MIVTNSFYDLLMETMAAMLCLENHGSCILDMRVPQKAMHRHTIWYTIFFRFTRLTLF